MLGRCGHRQRSAARAEHASAARSGRDARRRGASRRTGGDIVVTGSRIRRDPLDQDQPIVFVDQADIAKTGLNSVTDVLQRLPSSGGALNSKFNNRGNFGNPPDGGGVGAGAAEIDLRYLGSRRVLVLVDGLRYVNGASASGVPGLGRPQLHPRKHDRADRGAAGRRLGDLRLGRDRRRGQHHHQAAARRASAPRPSSAAIGEGDGFTPELPAELGQWRRRPAPGRRRRQLCEAGRGQLGRPRDLAASRRLAPTACDGGCSSGTPQRPLHRSAILGQRPDADRAGHSAAIRRRRADFQAFVSPADRFNFAPFNFIQIPLERYGVFVNVKPRAWRQRQFLGQAASATSASRRTRRRRCRSFVGPDAGNGNLLDTIVDRRHQPVQSVRRHAAGDDLTHGNDQTLSSAAASSRAGRAATTRRSTPTTASATLDGTFDMLADDWYWDVNARLGPEQGRAEDARQHQRRPTCGRRFGPVAACTDAAACRSNLRRRRVDHPGDARLCRLHPARQQRADDCGTSPPTCPAACSSCPAGRSASPSASNIATSRAGSIPIRSSPRASAPTFRRCRPRAATTSTRPMPN